MAIPDEDIARVRAATDLAALVGEHSALKRVGHRFVGLCPFHAERTPSFSVNAEEGLYYCFGCQASGDAISFVRAVEGCDFVEAVERLGGRAGIAVRDDADPGAAAERGRRQQLFEVMGEAAAFYHERLLTDPEARRARQYLRSRGYDGAVVRRFGIGFATPGADGLARALHRPAGLLRAAGLAYEAGGRVQDAFRERVIFPVADPGGRPVALGGRILPEELRSSGRDPGPKYRNSPESPIYQKRRTLYGLHWAKADIARSGEAVVCEGYTDVIGFFLAGVPRAVATCGTALTEDHLRLLGRFARRVVLAFDADRAGEGAAERLYEWERRHDLELRVALLPAGSDPAELALAAPERLRCAVEEARPFLAFQLDQTLGAADLSSPEGRARAATTALRAVAAHPNELVRDAYLLQVADRCRQDPDRLRPLLARAREEVGRAARAPAATLRRRPTGRPGAAAGEPRSQRDETASQPDGPPFYEDDGRYDEPALVPEPEPPGLPAQDPDPPAGTGAARPAGRPAAGGRRSGPARRATEEGPRPGRDALLLAVHRPSEVAELLDETCFVDPVQRRAFQALGTAMRLGDAIERAGPAAGALLSRLANSDGADGLDVAGTVVAVVRHAGEAALRELLAEARLVAARPVLAASGQLATGGELAGLNETASWLKGELVRLGELAASELGGQAALSQAEALVAWLSQRQAQGGGAGLEADVGEH